MPRKKSASGRARGFSSVNQIILQAEKINKQIAQLEKADRFGSYKSKELIEFVSRTPSLKLVKSKHKNKRRRVVIIDATNIKQAEQRLIHKKLGEISRSSGFSPVGIMRIERNIRRQIRKTLSEELGRDIGNKELEKFFDIIKYKEQANQSSILDKIDPSTFWRLVNTAVSEHMSETSWVSMLENYVEINNEYMREEAKYLYERYVKPSR